MVETNSSPFSGAATAPPKPAPNRRQRQRKTPKGRKHDWTTWTNPGQPAFPPHFAGSFQQAQTPPAFLGQDREAAYEAELQRCYAAMAITAPAEHVFAAAGNMAILGTKMAIRPMATLVLVLVVFIVGYTAGTTAMTAHNVA